MDEPIRWELFLYRGNDKVGEEVFSGQSSPSTPSDWDEAMMVLAPHIARAAKVQVLRELADEIDGKHAIDAADLQAKADELEQGAL